MSDKTMKPVWRMNTGREVPSDLGSFVIYVGSSKKEKVQGFHFNHDHKWGLIGYKDIAAYQTTRTREAKYERVECKYCANSLFKGLVYCGGYFEYRKCPECNGKGYTRELIK